MLLVMVNNCINAKPSAKKIFRVTQQITLIAICLINNPQLKAYMFLFGNSYWADKFVGSFDQGFKLIFCGDSVLEFRLSERHSMFLVAHDFVWKRRPREARISSERLIWRFDKHDIFTFEKVEYALCPVNEESRLLRRHFKSSGAVEQEANRRYISIYRY